jgi:hypothetical protein
MDARLGRRVIVPEPWNGVAIYTNRVAPNAFGSAFSGFYRSKTGEAPIYPEDYLTHIPSYLNNLKAS